MPCRTVGACDINHDGTIDDQFSFIATNNHLAIQLEKVSSGMVDRLKVRPLG